VANNLENPAGIEAIHDCIVGSKANIARVRELHIFFAAHFYFPTGFAIV
jgi:hypothetical protein